MTYTANDTDIGSAEGVVIYSSKADYDNDPRKTAKELGLVPVEDSQTAHVSIPAGTTAYTITRDIEYSQNRNSSSAMTYTIYTPTDTSLAHAFSLQLTNSTASTIAFKTTANNPITVYGTAITTGFYIVFGNWDYSSNSWKLWSRKYE